MMRVAVLGLHHETNTFSSVLAGLDDYRDGGIHTGSDLVAHYGSSQATFGGFLEGIDADTEVVAVPLLAAMVNPCGPVSEDAFLTITREMIALLADVGPVDGVLLGLHGACVAVGHPCADAEMAEQVRAVVGPQVPIGSVVDLHANLEPRLIEAVDILLAYRTNPHIDARERGAECCRMLLEVIRTGQRPALVLEQIPLAVAIVKQDTSTEPMAGLLAAAVEAEQAPGMLDVSVIEGFPYADVPHLGMSVIAMHPDADAARAAAKAVGERVWGARHDLQGGGVGVEEALEVIRTHRGDKPLLVLDVGDNIGGGGPGDSTVLLAAVLDEQIPGVVGTVFDPVAVQALQAAQVGSGVDRFVGGRSAEQDGRPVRLVGTVVGRHSGLYEEPRIAHGGFRFFDGGDMIAVRTALGQAVVLTSKVVQTVTPVQLLVVGLDPGDFRAVIGKGVNAPRAGYAQVCGDLLVVDTPGVTRNSVTGFEYRHRRRPMYPYEPDASYP